MWLCIDDLTRKYEVNMLAKQTEAEFVQAAAHGDAEAYEQLVRKYRNRLLTAVIQVVRQEVEAEDIVQDAFLAAYTNLLSFRRECSFYTWTYRIAMNLASDRRRRTRPVYSLDECRETTGDGLIDDGEAPDDRMLRAERLAEIQTAVANLDADQQAVLVMRAVGGFDYHTIGTVLGVKVGTVRSRLHRARTKVHTALQHEAC